MNIIITQIHINSYICTYVKIPRIVTIRLTESFSVSYLLPSYNKIPLCNNHLGASITTKLIPVQRIHKAQGVVQQN